jgi:hypothetical protein
MGMGTNKLSDCSKLLMVIEEKLSNGDDFSPGRICSFMNAKK